MASSVFATNKVNSNADVKSAENTVREQLAGALSNVSADESSDVYVYFKVSSKTGFELIDVKGLDAELAGKVKSTLKSKNFVTPAILDGTYLVKVKFTNI